MIEEVIRNHLSTVLSAPVYLQKPDSASGSYVFFEKTGSGNSNKLGSSTFAFQSYAPSLYETAQLNELVKAAVESLIGLNEISKIKLNSDYNFTDTTTKKYRYQSVFDIYHY